MALAVDVVDAEGSAVTVVVEVSGEGVEVVVGASEQPAVTTTSANNPRHLTRRLTSPIVPAQAPIVQQPLSRLLRRGATPGRSYFGSK